MSEKEMNPMKEAMLQDLSQVSQAYISMYKKEITPEYYYAYSMFTKLQVEELFGSFKKMWKALLTYNAEEVLTRKSFNIKKNDQKNKYPRKYVVTAAIAGAALQHDLFETLQTICKDQKAQLVILPMRGIHSADAAFDEDILQHSNYFCTEYQFNDHLKAQDFKLNPQQIQPLTGIIRFGQKNTSILVAAPKMNMKCVPVGASMMPHIVRCTGTVTMPDYADTRNGNLAKQDHVFGALLVEVKDKKTFFTRELMATPEFGIYDLNKYYYKSKITPSTASAFIMGDLHCGSEDPAAIKAWKECIELVKPKTVVLHDILDCATINHHQKNNKIYRANLPKNMQTLEQELNIVSDTLHNLTKDFPKTTFAVTKGNHDSWLDEFLEEGLYAEKEHYNNLRISLPLVMDLLDKKNPLQEYVQRRYPTIKNLVWLDVDSDYKIEGVQCGAHCDKGSNGGKASISSLELQYGNAFVGHKHSPETLRNTWVAGTSTYLKLEYNKGGGSSWLQGSGLIHPGGTKQQIICVNGEWRI